MAVPRPKPRSKRQRCERIPAYTRCRKKRSDARKALALMRLAEAAADKQKEDAQNAKASASKADAEAKAKVATARKRSTKAKTPEASKAQKQAAKTAQKAATAAKTTAAAKAREAQKAQQKAKQEAQRAKKAEVQAAKAEKTASKKPGSKYAGDSLGGILGNETELMMPSVSCLRKEPARYRLTEVGNLKPSHNGLTFRATAGYPKGVQERRYSTDKSEQQKVIGNAQASCFEPSIIANTDPTPLGGAPIASFGGWVIGGNSRAMVLQRIWAEPSQQAADEYRKWLRAHARDWGFTADDVASYSQPVLVRATGITDLKAAVRVMNEPLTQALDVTAQQVAVAARVDDGLVKELADAMGSDQSLTDFFKSQQSKGFVRLLQQKAVITRQQTNALIAKNGLLNEDGRRHVSRALVGRILQDADALDLLFQALPSLRNNLARAVPFILAASTAGPKWDITNAMPDAALLFSAVRSSGAKDVQTWLRQRSLFDRGGMNVTTASVLLATIFLNKPGPLQLANGFQKFANAASQSQTLDMFGPPPPPVEALAKAFGLKMEGGDQIIPVKDFAPAAGAKPGQPARPPKALPVVPVEPAPQSVALGASTKCKPTDELPFGRKQFYVDITSNGDKVRWCVETHFSDSPSWVVVGTRLGQSARMPFGWFRTASDADKAIKLNRSPVWTSLKRREAKRSAAPATPARAAKAQTPAQIFDSLKPSQPIWLALRSVSAGGRGTLLDGNWHEHKVGRRSKGRGYERIGINKRGGGKTASISKISLYKRNGDVSAALGDMGISIEGMTTTKPTTERPSKALPTSAKHWEKSIAALTDTILWQTYYANGKTDARYKNLLKAEIDRREKKAEDKKTEARHAERLREKEQVKKAREILFKRAATLPIKLSPSDLDLRQAQTAYSATSWSPEKRAHNEQVMYVSSVIEVYDRFKDVAKTPRQKAILIEELERYRQGYLKRRGAVLAAKGRTMSAAVVGPAKFPTRRNNKAMDVEHKRTKEFLDWDKKARNAIRKKLAPASAGPIVSGTPDAVERLQAKLVELQAQHAHMKAVNQALRTKTPTARLRALGLSEADAKAMIARHPGGRAPFHLTNSNANMKRVSERIEKEKRIRKERAAPGRSTGYPFKGGRVSFDIEDNRIRLLFSDKPDAPTRTKLKRSGFRWSNRHTAWQRQLTDNGKWAAERVLRDLGLIGKLSTDVILGESASPPPAKAKSKVFPGVVLGSRKSGALAVRHATEIGDLAEFAAFGTSKPPHGPLTELITDAMREAVSGMPFARNAQRLNDQELKLIADKGWTWYGGPQRTTDWATEIRIAAQAELTRREKERTPSQKAARARADERHAELDAALRRKAASIPAVPAGAKAPKLTETQERALRDLDLDLSELVGYKAPTKATLASLAKKGLVKDGKLTISGHHAIAILNAIKPSAWDRGCLQRPTRDQQKYFVDITHQGKSMRWCAFPNRASGPLRYAVVVTIPMKVGGVGHTLRKVAYWARTKREAERSIKASPHIREPAGLWDPKGFKREWLNPRIVIAKRGSNG